MAKYTIKSRTEADREVEAVGYIHEGDFFVFYDRFNTNNTAGDPRAKVLTLEGGDVLSIEAGS